MIYPRTEPVFDGGQSPSTWNERMRDGEFAVHYSSFKASDAAAFCTIFPELAQAVAFARQQVAAQPALRCRIYDHHGLVGAPLQEIRGKDFKSEGEISPRFRRWAGSLLFLGGAGLLLLDWANDFRLNWPALIGARLLIPGLILLSTEAVILLLARRQRSTSAGRTA